MTGLRLAFWMAAGAFLACIIGLFSSGGLIDSERNVDRVERVAAALRGETIGSGIAGNRDERNDRLTRGLIPWAAGGLVGGLVVGSLVIMATKPPAKTPPHP
jgi:hypothetical protein